MNQGIKMFEDAIEHWRISKGRGTAIIPSNLDDRLMIQGVLQNLYNKNPTAKIVIVVKDFSDRTSIIEYLTTKTGDNCEEFEQLIVNKFIRVFTESFVINSDVKFLGTILCIWYRPDEYNINVKVFVSSHKFILTILNKRLDNVSMVNLYSFCPVLDDFRLEDLQRIRMSTPVRETFIPIEIPKDTEDYNLIRYYDDYIEKSINIFGNFYNIEYARNGNKDLNKSAIDVCYEIAYKNGWNNTLDMSSELNVKLDGLYNPNNLNERANETYKIIRERQKFLANYKSKIDEVIKIVKENEGRRILIISKFGEFANDITTSINFELGKVICGNYHDKVEQIPMVDDNCNPILYKSGAKKGKPRFMGADAQKTQNEFLFNCGKLNVLSTNNAPDKDLNIEVDVVIITSPMCEEIENYLYRLAKVEFPAEIELYTLFVKSSIEHKKVKDKAETKTHTFVNKIENDFVAENNFDYAIAY